MPVSYHHPVPRDATVYVAGHHGLVGSAIWRHLTAEGFTNLVGLRSAELDLRDRAATQDFFAQARPAYVIDAAARVGGILANDRAPADFISDNLRIQTNLIDAAHEFGVARLLFLGSSCIYPRMATQPIREDALLTRLLTPWGAWQELRDQLGSVRGVYLAGNRVHRRDDMGEHPELVLLLHGFFQTRNIFEVMEDRLRHDGYGVVSFNLGGLLHRFNTHPIDRLAELIAGRKVRVAVPIQTIKISSGTMATHSRGVRSRRWDRTVSLASPKKARW